MNVSEFTVHPQSTRQNRSAQSQSRTFAPSGGQPRSPGTVRARMARAMVSQSARPTPCPASSSVSSHAWGIPARRSVRLCRRAPLDQRINELAVIIDALECVAVCQGGSAEVRWEAGFDATGVVKPRQLDRLELDLASGEVVEELGTGPRSYDWDRHRSMLLGTHPRDGDLAGSRAERLRDLVQRISHEQVPLGHSLLFVLAANAG